MSLTRKIALVLLLPLFSLFLQCAAGFSDEAPPAGEDWSQAPSPGESALEAEVTPVDVENPLIILDALTRAYPDRIRDPALRDGDWSVYINDELFYWADGRMLNASDRENKADFRAYSFRPNSQEIPEVRELSEAERNRIERYIAGREARQDGRNEAFMNALWGMTGYMEAENTVIIREFLGTRIRIHPGIEEPLMRVQQKINTAAREDPEVAAWYESLGAIGAYVWRDIAGSANRSLHSYGIAVDIQPAVYGNRVSYWRWAADFTDEWWAIPHSRRYMPPPAVVEAFETEGFFWGGKWFLFDQMHFEYRPELIILGKWAAGIQ